MGMFSKLSFKSFAVFGTAALIVSSAYAFTSPDCRSYCQQAAQNAYNQSYTYYVGQQTNYCYSLSDSSARSACLAGVPAYANQQATNVYNQAYNGCMNNCTPG